MIDIAGWPLAKSVQHSAYRGGSHRHQCAASHIIDMGLSYIAGTPTKRQVSKRQVSKCPVSKRLKHQVYKTSGLQNVGFAKCQFFETSGCKKNIHIYSVLVVGGNPQVLLQPCLQAK
jgi:hypothetical protein